MAALVRDWIALQMREISRLEPLVRRGDDVEAVHDFRVAVRRLRAFRELLPPEFDEDARWIGRVLGEARDRDVQREVLREWASEDPDLDSLIGLLIQERLLVQSRVVAALDSPRFARFLTTSISLDIEGPEPGWEEPYADRAEAKVRKAANLDAESAGPDFHRLRKRGKRLRYVLEALEPALGKSARAKIEELKELQDLAGARQDDATTIETVQRLLREPDLPRTATKAGERLIIRLEKRERKHRAQLLRALS